MAEIDHFTCCLYSKTTDEREVEAIAFLDNALNCLESFYDVEDYHMQLLPNEAKFHLRECHCHE